MILIYVVFVRFFFRMVLKLIIYLEKSVLIKFFLWYKHCILFVRL